MVYFTGLKIAFKKSLLLSPLPLSFPHCISCLHLHVHTDAEGKDKMSLLTKMDHPNTDTTCSASATNHQG